MISAVVLTKNNEKLIERCIVSLGFCEELLIIDDGSTDKTLEIAKKQRKDVHIYSHTLDGDFSKQRNFGLKKAKGEWVLFIDSDEEVSDQLQEEIKKAVGNKTVNGYSLKRKDYFKGRWLTHGETSHVTLLRLGRRGKGEWARPVHEVWNIEEPLQMLENPLHHYAHETISEFLADINTYSTMHARVSFEEGKRATFFTVISKPVGKFILNYFVRCGFLDGMQGLIMAIMMSFHSFLAQGKLWQMQNKQIEV